MGLDLQPHPLRRRLRAADSDQSLRLPGLPHLRPRSRSQCLLRRSCTDLPLPLIAAAAFHSFFDGWSVATIQLTVPLGLRVAVPLAVALHKAPEGVALGGILRASVHSRSAALGWCVSRRRHHPGWRHRSGSHSRRTWALPGSCTRSGSPPVGSSISDPTPSTRNGSGAAPLPAFHLRDQRDRGCGGDSARRRSSAPVGFCGLGGAGRNDCMTCHSRRAGSA